MTFVLEIKFLTVRQFDHQALEAPIINRLAVCIEHADAPCNLFLTLKLARQHAERPCLSLLGPAYKVAFKEKFACLLCERRDGSPPKRARSEHANCERLHQFPLPRRISSLRK